MNKIVLNLILMSSQEQVQSKTISQKNKTQLKYKFINLINHNSNHQNNNINFMKIQKRPIFNNNLIYLNKLLNLNNNIIIFLHSH
jgi:hypothetical protein